MGEMSGAELLGRAKQLVLDTLGKARGGMTAAQVQSATGLYLEVPVHKGYITWTILHNLIVEGKVVKKGRLYQVAE